MNSTDVTAAVTEIQARLELAQKRFNQAEYDARRAESLKRQTAVQVEQLRSGWNAPQRHVANHGNLTKKGAWLETRNKVFSKIGDGFLIGILGPRGNGKTQIAVETMFETTARGRTARYMTSTEFFMAIKATYSPNAKENEGACLARFARINFLVVDEISKRSENDWENRLLFELLDRRYRNLMDTLIISNQSRTNFIDAIGASLADRMNESGGLIECDWESFRQ